MLSSLVSIPLLKLESFGVRLYLHHASTGMEDVEYRKLALKRFLAFKALAEIHWRRILEGV